MNGEKPWSATVRLVLEIDGHEHVLGTTTFWVRTPTRPDRELDGLPGAIDKTAVQARKTIMGFGVEAMNAALEKTEAAT